MQTKRMEILETGFYITYIYLDNLEFHFKKF